MRNISIRYLGPFISRSLVLMVPLKGHNTSDTVCICSSLDIGSNHGHIKKRELLRLGFQQFWTIIGNNVSINFFGSQVIFCTTTLPYVKGTD